VIRRALAFTAALGAMLATSACFGPEEPYTLPEDVKDFKQLFTTNCAGCHGMDGHNGAARPLNDPLYQALVKKERLIEAISKGVRGMAMPAFAKSAGGMLTDSQIEILAAEMQKNWSKPAEFTGVTLPEYAAALGDTSRGEAAFQTYCASCHGADGMGIAKKGGSVVDPMYLMLASDQALRLAVIAGRPDQGAPDYRNDVPGHPMQAQEIADVVAWLASHRDRKLP
jgi:cytochrome c oxidase cbb3-type subunit 3